MGQKFNWKIEPFKIETVISLIKEKKLILRPEYQRRSVWSKSAKSALIETIIQEKPIPLFLIHKKQNGILEVIDGQQRLRSISDFASNNLKLTNVDATINDKLYQDLISSLFVDYKNLFNEYELYFNLIENATEDDIIDMYSRVNKYTVNLNKMEMRYALSHDTNIMKYIEKLLDNEEILEFFLKSDIFTQTNMSRMGDIEFFTQLLSYMLSNTFMNKDESITDFFSEYNDISDERKRELEESFISVLNLIKYFFSGEEFKEYFELDKSQTSDFYLKNTRFKQKNDFLSLFCTLYTLTKYVEFNQLSSQKISEIRNFLIFMDCEIAPQSNLSITSMYGIKCVSQANTKSSREFRSKFILEGFNYILGTNYYDEFDYALNNSTNQIDKVNFIENLFSDIIETYELEANALRKEGNSTFKDVLDILWAEDV